MRNYSTLDETNLGTDLVLSEGDNIVAPATFSTVFHMARCTIAQSRYPSSVECMVYSPDGTAPTLNSQAVIGIMFEVDNWNDGTTDHTNAEIKNRCVGQDFFSFAYHLYDGMIWNNNADFTQFDSATYGDYLRLDLDPPNGTVAIYKNGTLLGVVTTGYAGQAWKYCASVGGNAGQRAIWMNPGVTPMRYIPPSNNGGWWLPAPVIESLLLSTEGYIGKALNDWEVPYILPNYNEKYVGDIDDARNPLSLFDSVHFSPWGASAPAELGSGGLAAIHINDPGGKYGDLLNDAARGMQLPLYRTRTNTPIADAEHLFVGVVDHCEQDTLSTKILYARDQRSRLAVPLRRALYPPDLIPSVASKPRSMSLGAVRNYLPEQLDKDGKVYGAHDGAITGVGQCRIGGVPKTFGSGSGLVLSADGASFVFTTAPTAQFTAETTSTGVAFNPAQADALLNYGNFKTCNFDSTYRMPNLWTSSYATDPIDTSGHRISDGSATDRFFIHSVGAQKLKCISQPNIVRGFSSVTSVIKARRTYVYKLEILNVPQHGLVMGGGSADPAYLYLCPQENYSAEANIVPFGTGEGRARIALDHVTDDPNYPLIGMFTSQFDANKPLCFVLAGNLVRVGQTEEQHRNNALSTHFLGLGKCTLYELPAITDNMTLDGPGFDAMLRALIIDRGPVEQPEYNSADAEAIDQDTGYLYGLRVASTETPTVDDCVRQLCNSCLVDIYNDDDGMFRAMRLFAPELVPIGEVKGTLRSVRGELVKYPDLAENLSSRASGCRNYDPMVFNDGDILFDPVTGVPMDVRAKLSATYQWTVTAGIRLAERYRHAYNAEPLLTLLDQKAHGQDLVKYINTLYKDARNFYVGDFYWPFGKAFKLGDVWNVQYDLDGLEDGRQLVIVGRQRQPGPEWCKLIFWGL